jgi:NTE family protein
VKNRLTKKRRLVFALGGGGARGALQAGALRALLEAGIQPDLLVGTSVGAVNAIFLALRGFNPQSLNFLRDSWMAAAKADLLPANTAYLTMRIFFNRVLAQPYKPLRDFFIAQGVSPSLQFRDLPHFPVIMVSADLNHSQPVYHGSRPDDSVLEGLLASTALPPWVHPIESEDRFLIDGGAVSNLPIEAAVIHGASEIIALGLTNPDEIETHARGFGPFWTKYLYAVETRQISLELQLAEAKGVPVHKMTLKTEIPISPWDFSRTEVLLDAGYQQMKQALDSGEVCLTTPAERWLAPFTRLFSS